MLSGRTAPSGRHDQDGGPPILAVKRQPGRKQPLGSVMGLAVSLFTGSGSAQQRAASRSGGSTRCGRRPQPGGCATWTSSQSPATVFMGVAP
jgi:hypothetical protein